VSVLALSIGSNINPAKNIRAVVKLLRAEFGAIELSRVYESEAVGFEGEDFMNLVAVAHCDLALIDVLDVLKTIENQLGRDRSKPKFSGRTMDVDILFYGASTGEEAHLALPRDEITKNAFVLLPLSELLPELIHNPTGLSYETLWQQYDKSKQKLWAIDFEFDF
jgi:2-amino-4-hydroxy-6-hydroxymethyldihydropteridine diphosphokinase